MGMSLYIPIPSKLGRLYRRFGGRQAQEGMAIGQQHAQIGLINVNKYTNAGAVDGQGQAGINEEQDDVWYKPWTWFENEEEYHRRRGEEEEKYWRSRYDPTYR